MKLRKRRLLWDLETTGLLPYLADNIHDDKLSRVHILAIRDLDTLETFVFRKNDEMDNILDGIAMLNEAEFLTGHNILNFDMPCLWLLYGDAFQPQGKVRDTLILCRMMFSDEKEKDYRRVKRGQMEGRLIGLQGLEAWGQRLEQPKDDYSARMKEKAKLEGLTDKEEIARYVWAEWSQDMEDYCVQDLDTNEILYRKIEKTPWSEEATILEHRVAELMDRVKTNGFPFQLLVARAMEAELRKSHDEIAEECIAHFGLWQAPAKWNRVGKARSKDAEVYQLRPEFGEDDSRKSWGDVNVPLKDAKWKDPMAKGGDKVAGAAYCPLYTTARDGDRPMFVGREFNPNSRPQIVDRLSTVYEWEPQEEQHTEAGNPIVDDEVLRELANTIPICLKLADLFYYKKRLGQLVDGKNGLIGKAEERHDSRIHPTINVGGTVTNRASHSDPNIAQVPRVVNKKMPVIGPDGQPLLDGNGEVIKKSRLLKGYEGNHGWDFRRLFTVLPGFVLMGSDMKGIELRALAHFMAEFDQGEYMAIVVGGDPHTLHQQAMGIDSRDTAKTVIYALIYGAQDFKLGCTVDPMLSNYPVKAKALGAQVRRNLMTRIPALAQVTKAVQREAKGGSVRAMDGRELFVRAKHSALNTKLQGCGATLAKQWCVLFEQYMEEMGYVHSWEGDFAILAWVHDELQVAVRDDPQIRADAKACIERAALDAGRHFEFSCPVDVDTKFGDEGHDPDAVNTWASTH